MFQLGESLGWSTFGEQGKSWDLSQVTPQTRSPWFSQELRCGDVRGKALVPLAVPLSLWTFLTLPPSTHSPQLW